MEAVAEQVARLEVMVGKQVELQRDMDQAAAAAVFPVVVTVVDNLALLLVDTDVQEFLELEELEEELHTFVVEQLVVKMAAAAAAVVIMEVVVE